ncbi:kinase domain-containing protein [Xylaria acuta]|nr:kinase domain-containing protein [Xylaria acuta]
MLRTSVKGALTGSETSRRNRPSVSLQRTDPRAAARRSRLKFVLKDIPKSVFSNFNENIQPRLREHPNTRLPSDTIRDERIFVAYRYLTDDFLSLAKKQISLRARKRILKASLQGIVEQHDRDIVHLNIKPDNILLSEVQISGLESAAYLPRGRCVKGMLAGNDNWRCPEGHFKGELNKPSDVSSFGVVCIYAVLGCVIFGPDDDFRKHEAQGALPTCIRLQWLWEDRTAGHIPYKSFLEWSDVSDAGFKDLIQGMMNLDPTKRITVR